MALPEFRYGETDLIRTQKLNELAGMVDEENATLDVDGGDASGVSNPLISLDGGGA